MKHLLFISLLVINTICWMYQVTNDSVFSWILYWRTFSPKSNDPFRELRTNSPQKKENWITSQVKFSIAWQRSRNKWKIIFNTHATFEHPRFTEQQVLPFFFAFFFKLIKLKIWKKKNKQKNQMKRKKKRFLPEVQLN